MNLVCHCTACGYCVNERCANPTKIITAQGLCHFRYANNGTPRVLFSDYTDKESINITDAIPVKPTKD